jgi:hypothetical protein
MSFHAEHMGEMRNVYKVFIEKPEGRPRNRLEDNNEMKEIRWEDADWIHQIRNKWWAFYCGHGNEPSSSINFLTVLKKDSAP